MLIAIENTPRDYAWGSTTAIAELLGHAPTGAPEAELWLGAHPGSPSRVVGAAGSGDSAAGADTLLDVVDGRLPFLLKVLAAATPLSLQAHPTPEQAEAGFARENAAGVPEGASDRNYKDAFHKPELIFALSDPFRALCGFRAVEQTLAVLEPVAAEARIAPLVERLRGVADAADEAGAAADASGGDSGDARILRSTFEWLISGGDDVDALVAALIEAAAEADGPSWQTVRQLADHYPGDPGIAISLLINSVSLSPGEVLYLPAGNIHAYLEGLGIELMAASDNVLRGGLTPKHVDVPELLDVLDFEPLPVPYLSPSHPAPGISVFRPDVPDFELTVVADAALGRGSTLDLAGPAIILCTDGAVTVTRAVDGSAGGAADAEVAPLERGGALYVADEPRLELQGEGTLFVASARSTPVAEG
ncbi:MAG: mannose-6-phosphate isomerase, class I [Microbacteriaceae bacterium]